MPRSNFGCADWGKGFAIELGHTLPCCGLKAACLERNVAAVLPDHTASRHVLD